LGRQAKFDPQPLMFLCPVLHAGVLFFYFVFYLFFTNKPLRKFILYLLRLDGALDSLKRVRLIGALCVDMDVGTPWWIVGR
jgi:hypothetical protein